jgi:hypothetical protein
VIEIDHRREASLGTRAAAALRDGGLARAIDAGQVGFASTA